MTAFTVSGVATPDSIDRMTDQILSFLDAQNVEPRPKHHAALIVQEILTNLGTHGGCRDKPAHVAIAIEPDGIRGRIVDSGPAFDPTAAPAPDLAVPFAERPEGGLGLHLVRQAATELEYSRTNGENCLEFMVARR